METGTQSLKENAPRQKVRFVITCVTLAGEDHFLVLHGERGENAVLPGAELAANREPSALAQAAQEATCLALEVLLQAEPEALPGEETLWLFDLGTVSDLPPLPPAPDGASGAHGRPVWANTAMARAETAPERTCPYLLALSPKEPASPFPEASAVAVALAHLRERRWRHNFHLGPVFLEKHRGAALSSLGEDGQQAYRALRRHLLDLNRAFTALTRQCCGSPYLRRRLVSK